MDTVVAEYATVDTPDAFWTNLAAVLRDEIVIREAQAAGMDWPELDDGHRRLAATRARIVTTASERGWISSHDARLYRRGEATEALAAARPWTERAERRVLDAVEAGPAR